MEEQTTIPKRKKTLTGLLMSLILLVVVLGGATGYFFYRYQALAKSPAGSQLTAQKEAKKLVQEVGKLMVLPKDETPTVATITDIDKLKDQQFFKDAKNDNKVLIYPNAKLAIIYDPKANLIVNVGPINFSQPQTDQQTQQPQKINIALRNGTDMAGLTYKMETNIKANFPDVNVVLKDKGGKTDYEKTMVIALNDGSRTIAEEMAKKLDSQVINLPDGETKPDGVDILIIIGKDKS